MPFLKYRNNEKRLLRSEKAFFAIKEASQSLRPQAQIKFKNTFRLANVRSKSVRCGEPQPLQTRA